MIHVEVYVEHIFMTNVVVFVITIMKRPRLKTFLDQYYKYEDSL